MAGVRSLGVHTPVGLPYLVAEGLLLPNCTPDQYQWDTYPVRDGTDDMEDEVLATPAVVVWSRGKFIRSVHRFDLENEQVVQAVLTTFPAPYRSQVFEPHISIKTATPLQQARDPFHLLPLKHHGDPLLHPQVSGRALVVILKSKAHIYFQEGSSHIVELPFEVIKAFAAPKGLLLQRRRTTGEPLAPSPQLPSAPPNSFWSTQDYSNSTQRHSLSPSLARSFAKGTSSRSKPGKPSPLSGSLKLDSLFRNITVPSDNHEYDDVTNLYSLSSPFSDMGVITYSLQSHKPRTPGNLPAGVSMEFEGLDPTEQIVYVTPTDELGLFQDNPARALMLLVTFNTELDIVTVWHAWYVEERSLKSLLKLRMEQTEAKVRRRSSFLNTHLGTGTTTPAVRRREGARESLIAPGQPQGDVGAYQGINTVRKAAQQDEEALASQMDPDYIPATSQQPARDNRRISSMNADARASHITGIANFGTTVSRRATSFGGIQGRRSFSHRKSRGSTPGSIYGNSLGGDDEFMDPESTIEFDADESVDDVLQHMRATFNATGTDSIFGNIEGGFKREVVLRKIHSYPVRSPTPSQQKIADQTAGFKAVTSVESPKLGMTEDSQVKVFVLDYRNSEVQCVSLKVKQRVLWPAIANSPVVALPIMIGENTINQCKDILLLQDGSVKGALLSGRGLQYSPTEKFVYPLPPQAPYRAFEQFEFLPGDVQIGNDVGRNRTLSLHSSPVSLEQSGAHASYDEVTPDHIHHRRTMQLRAEDPRIETLLLICDIMLPKEHTGSLRGTWCWVLAQVDGHSENLTNTASGREFVALTCTIFLFVLAMLDTKARAALQISKVAAGRRRSGLRATARLQKAAHERRLATAPAWLWLSAQQATVSHRQSKSEEKDRDNLLLVSTAMADELSSSIPHSREISPAAATRFATKVMLALHAFREEEKLCSLNGSANRSLALAPVIAQLGLWLNLEPWSPSHSQYYGMEGVREEQWVFVKSKATVRPQLPFLERPTSVFEWFEHAIKHETFERYPSIFMIAQIGSNNVLANQSGVVARNITPRTTWLSDVLSATHGFSCESTRMVELLETHKTTIDTLETLPESIAVPLREAISQCEREPPTTWTQNLLQLVGRDDLDIEEQNKISKVWRPQPSLSSTSRDIQTACHSLDQPFSQAKTKEAGRHAVSQLIFSEDRRLVEATSLMHFNNIQTVQCPKQPDWDDDQHFQNQRKAVHWATVRMIALPAGDAMLHYDSQTPLLTERYHLPGFSSSCLIQPMGYHLAPERTGLTEEKVSWAYFHAGASAGLRISHNVKGIDTSWIAFNKPPELQNRHAGLLFALGLGGHLRRIAKWLLFKYLTPKHTMTSVGLLLGLSASYIGTMDGLVTRMLSVHITRMLPAGAAELNVTPATQAAGMMGIGLVYHNTQHRRMSEVMLSEIEHMEIEDPDSGPDSLRDESYRLSTGFALGLINVGNGNNLRGLHGMNLLERLLAIAVGPRPVNAVHVFDRATAGAVVALALVYMKTGNKAVAHKIDIPDTETQFDQVRPDILMLRAMAKHVILWDNVEAKGIIDGNPGWIQENLPRCYKHRLRRMIEHMRSKHTIDSTQIPLFNIFTGLAWALSLKYAGSNNELARDEILELLKFCHDLSSNTDAYYFNGKLGRSALRRCMDMLALSAASVMAGTGDLETFRYLRRMHGRVDSDTPYGSHLAVHMAIGVLFLGGGTYTLGTSNLAVASLICAFYPLFPMDVQDNRVHLQAFRHLWVLAAEARCIVVEDTDTHRPIHMPITVILRDGTEAKMHAPCLLPELDKIAVVRTANAAFWRVTLDFARNPASLAQFRKNQQVFVRRCPATEAHNSIFSAALAALNDVQMTQQRSQQVWYTLFNLKAFADLDRADIESLLPPDKHSSVYLDDRGTAVDDRLVLSKAGESSKRNELWNLRLLFAWAERIRARGDNKLRWIGRETMEALMARIEDRARRTI